MYLCSVRVCTCMNQIHFVRMGLINLIRDRSYDETIHCIDQIQYKKPFYLYSLDKSSSSMSDYVDKIYLCTYLIIYNL